MLLLCLSHCQSLFLCLTLSVTGYVAVCLAVFHCHTFCLCNCLSLSVCLPRSMYLAHGESVMSLMTSGDREAGDLQEARLRCAGGRGDA